MTVFDWIGYLGKIDPSILGEFSIQNPQTVCNISVTHDTYRSDYGITDTLENKDPRG